MQLFADDWATSFRYSGRHWLRQLRTGEGPLLWSGDKVVEGWRLALVGHAALGSLRFMSDDEWSEE